MVFSGSFIKDDTKVLINAHKDKTKALRQWRFESVEDLDQTQILKYIMEAINKQKQEKEIKSDRSKPLDIPLELKMAFHDIPGLDASFKSFTKGKQREFTEYISEAKKEKTKQRRLFRLSNRKLV